MNYTHMLSEVGIDAVLMGAIRGFNQEVSCIEAIVPRKRDGQRELGIIYTLDSWTDRRAFQLVDGKLKLDGFSYTCTSAQLDVIEKVFQDAFPD